ncbi:hypothetical protein [Sphingobium sp. BS19]|uniref:hypothetical protein n=2 Tax=unclassified Sphingobium TaxID=2611147 RepID=UPI0022EEA9B6|nr:hypothetical protein [Sphingobium sp. BS19]GLI99640.1 hypothetical protein Sbs19_34580 [Sphingobium sp. BS19]
MGVTEQASGGARRSPNAQTQIVTGKGTVNRRFYDLRCHCPVDPHIAAAMGCADTYTMFETQGRALPMLVRGDALDLLRQTFGGPDDARDLIAENRETIDAIATFLIEEAGHWQWSLEIDRDTMLRWGRQRDLWHWKPV